MIIRIDVTNNTTSELKNEKLGLTIKRVGLYKIKP